MSSKKWVTGIGSITIRIVSALLLLVTLLPFLSSGQWYVRVWDFPRLQIFILLIVPCLILGVLAFQKKAFEFRVWLLLLLAAWIWQGSHLVTFTPLWPTEVPSAKNEKTEHLRILVVNLKIENGKHEEVIDTITENDPDLLLLMETDQRWDKGLSELKANYPHRVEVLEDDGLGMCLWSRFKLSEVEKRYLVSKRRVSIWATVQTPQEPVRFVGVHPTPPGLKDETGEERRDSRVRDAELILVANEISEKKDQRWIVAGDFNDVAWSHTTRLFQRLSKMGDPRVGRNFLGTFHSEYPIFRVPIDHVFLSDGFGLSQMDRIFIPGSDHFGVTVDIQQHPLASNNVAGTEGNDRQEAQELVEEGKQDAAQRNVKN